MAQNGDVLQVKCFQRLTGIEGELLNVFYYQVGSLTSTVSLADNAEDIALSYADVWISLMTVIQSVGVQHIRLEMNNLMDYEGDYLSWSYETPIAGAVAGEYLSSAVAWSFQLVRATRTTRHGSKRIAGVPETYVSNNVAVAGTVTTQLNSFAAQLAQPLFVEYGGLDGMELTPVILKSPVLTTAAPTVINRVASGAYRGVGTQNSRKQLLP